MVIPKTHQIKFDHIDIVDYNPQAHIKMPVAV